MPLTDINTVVFQLFAQFPGPKFRLAALGYLTVGKC
jgi:hypothetical protein